MFIDVMIPLIAGIIFLFALFLFIYFVREKSHNDVKSSLIEQHIELTPVEIQPSPLQKDIILAQLTEHGKPSEYAILWNGLPGETYNYNIKDVNSNQIIVNNTLHSDSSVYRIKGLPLVPGSLYDVTVGNTTTRIQFSPVFFILESFLMENGKIDCNTSSTPTDIEVLISGVKLSRSSYGLKIEPPGFICNIDNPSGEIVIMLYNGPNTANILTMYSSMYSSSPNETQIF